MLQTPSPKEVIKVILSFEKEISRIEDALSKSGVFSEVSISTEVDAIKSIRALFHLPEEDDNLPLCYDYLYEIIFCFLCDDLTIDEASEAICADIEDIQRIVKESEDKKYDN